MSAFTTALEAYGLTYTEARVFEMGLKEGETDISDLSRVLDMNRSTVYHAVHELKQRGLVKKRTENGKLFIAMIRENLADTFFRYEEERLRERQETLRQFFAKLPQPKRKRSEPDVEYFTGFSGVRMALERAFRVKNKRWDIIAPKHNFFTDIDEEYVQYYLKERKLRGIISRSLWERQFESLDIDRSVIKERQPRYLPKICNGKFRSILILFDEHALFIPSKKEMQATLINSPDTYSVLQMQFDALWEVSTPVGLNKL